MRSTIVEIVGFALATVTAFVGLFATIANARNGSGFRSFLVRLMILCLACTAAYNCFRLMEATARLIAAAMGAH